MTKTILITGAAGFVGYHLSQALHARGDTVVGVDSFNDYYTPQLKRERQKLLEANGISCIEGDICTPGLISSLVEKHNVTHIAHMAAQAGVRYSLENPHAYIASNITGFLNVLESCRAHPHIKLTYASSSSVYGTNKKTPFSPTDRTDNQASLYGATKKSNELMAQTYHHLFDIPVTGLRFFTVYGPWGRPDMAYYSFARKIVDGEPIDVYNNGKLERDFTYIDDIIAGTIAAIDLEAPCEIFNLGNNQPVSLEKFISTLEGHLGKKAQKNYLPMQPGDVYTTFADIDHSQKKLGYSPTTSLEQGLKKFVKWFREYHQDSLNSSVGRAAHS